MKAFSPRGALGLGLFAVALSTGCFLLAPGPLEGVAEGGACGTDLDCNAGLACECGTCETPGAVDRPAACEIDVGNECPATPNVCYVGCGDETTIGTASCVDGREVCDEGVLRTDCPDTTCWGEPAPGQICNEGEWECQFQYLPDLDACQTFDCEGTPDVCVADCQAVQTMPMVCAGSAWRCQMGFPLAQCGPCPGTAPPCFDNCTNLSVVGVATCDDANGWMCGGTQQSEEDCCVDADGTYQTAGDLDDIADEVCLLGSVSMINNVGTVSFPNLRRAESLNLWASNAASFSAPLLTTVLDDFSLWENDSLTSVDVGSLAEVGGLLEIANNDALSQCTAEAIVAQVEAQGGVGGDTVVELNAIPDGGCDVVSPDGGPGPDAGPDAGLTDGGAPDAAVDGGSPDAASPDGGPDAGGVDAGGPDGGDAG